MPKQTMILLSDLHIGRGEKERERAIMVFNKIAKSFPGIPVIITGDLVDSASKPQFMEMRNLLDELARTNPILSAPGNHDYAWKGNVLRPKGWENWVEYLGSPLGWGRDQVHWMGDSFEPEGVEGLGVWMDDPCVYFGIDSGDPDDKVGSARGYISEKLANALKESLENYTGKTRIALLHHHPFTDGLFTRLTGSDLLLAALKDNCELLLFGHEHKYGVWWDNRGIPLIVSSHKSTNTISGACLVITVIDIEDPGTPRVSFGHRMEVA